MTDQESTIIKKVSGDIANGSKELIAFIEKEAQEEERDASNDGNTPLTIAKVNGHDAVIQKLEEQREHTSSPDL